MFQQPRIQLSTEETAPPLIKRSSSNWSIPCCSNFSIRGQRIQLPDDSDDEEQQQQQQEFTIPDATPFTMNFESANNNAFPQRSANLSRNPFARVEEDQPKVVPEQTATEETTAVVEEEELFQQQPGEEDVEELADFSRSVTANKYANEPDWTEMYQDEDDESVKDEPTVTTTNTTTTTTTTLNTQLDNTQVDTPSIIESILDQEEEERPKEEEEKIPQIDDKIFHYLPLPELSNEIPPTLIHKKPSFEKSMYGEEPLMSTYTRPSNNRISRFSMTEEDFLKLKKQEEEEKIKKIQKIVVVETPVLIESNQGETVVTQQQEERRSSIVATAAHSILGDKLDDFTEKLAFIKKNIIMSIDSDDEEDIEEADNAETTLKKIAQMKQDRASISSTTAKTSEDETRRPSLNHRRTSSLMDVAPSIARFMNQISGHNTTTTTTTEGTTPTTSSMSASFSPSSLFSALAGPEPLPTSTRSREDNKSTFEEDEELFDFTKVIEIGKNMKTFSEGVVGNGIRMFNDVATRIKLSAEEEERLRSEQAQEEGEEEEDNDHSNWLNDSYI